MLAYWKEKLGGRLASSVFGGDYKNAYDAPETGTVSESLEDQSRNMRETKRLRRTKAICSCRSPICGYTSLVRHSDFTCYDEDVWTEVAKYLDAKSLVMLGATSTWFKFILTEESVWKYVCLRDLQVCVSDPSRAQSKWKDIYVSAFDRSHTYKFRQQEKHIDWMRIGALSLRTPFVLLTEKLIIPEKLPEEETMGEMLKSNGHCVLDNVKTGIWIADLQLVRCPVCDLNTCDGTMQTLDARHIELFLSEGYQSGRWEYQLLGSHETKKHADGASGGIFDVKHLKDPSTSAIFNLKAWTGKGNDWQPKALVTCHAVAVSTNLQANDGLQVKYQIMKGDDGDVVSIRISQQLI